MIGSLGPVVFEASMNKVCTFDNLNRSGSSRWADHEIMRKKPVKEFLGPGAEQITLSIKLDVSFGVNPSNELFVLRFLRDQGIAVPLIMAGQPVSYASLWVIESLSEAWTNVDNKGNLDRKSVV